jgi:hypothetical protein
MREVLPGAYARLARALEVSLPLGSGADGVFDPSRVILTAYPDLVTNEKGEICQAAPSDSDEEDRYPANQSLDMFSSWLTARSSRLKAVREQFSNLHKRMRDLAGDHGWTFAGRIYADKMFEGHGFCAQNIRRISDPAEQLMIPCHGRPSATPRRASRASRARLETGGPIIRPRRITLMRCASAGCAASTTPIWW